MSSTYDDYQADQDRGYSDLDGEVCKSCIQDRDLQTLHDQHSSTGNCDFCQKRNCSVAPALIIQGRIMDSFSEEYAEINNAGAPWESREGGWQISWESAKDIVKNQLVGVLSEEFHDAITGVTQDDQAWCERDWEILSPSQLFNHSWVEFCDTVQHRLRFSFVWTPGSEEDSSHPDYTHPALTLQWIGQMIENHGIIKEIPAETLIKRVRVDELDYFTSMDEIGTPPHKYAKSNRMSPAGIPMFYGAEDFETSIRETWDGKHLVKCSKATFRLKKTIRIIDLTSLPLMLGFFSGNNRRARAALQFLHNMAGDMSQPVERNSNVDLEYAPTQVISEYLTKVKYETANSSEDNPNRIHGIIFRSSKTGRRNYALNLFHKEDKLLGDIQDDFLELSEVAHKKLLPKK